MQLKDLTQKSSIEIENIHGGALVILVTPKLVLPSVGSSVDKVATTDVGNPVDVEPESLAFPLGGLILR